MPGQPSDTDPPIEQILGWEFHETQTIEVNDFDRPVMRLGYWLPPNTIPGDPYGAHADCDDIIAWLDVTLQQTSSKVHFAYGGVPGRFYAGLLNALQPQIQDQGTLLAALTLLAKYVNKWKDSL